MEDNILQVWINWQPHGKHTDQTVLYIRACVPDLLRGHEPYRSLSVLTHQSLHSKKQVSYLKNQPAPHLIPEKQFLMGFPETPHQFQDL
jgi:hypothetical protein